MESLKFSDDETVVKDYNAAKIKKPSKGETHIVLTNKRIIINYQTPKSVLISDVSIDDVRGTDISWFTVKKMKSGLISLAIGIFSIVMGLVILSSIPFMGEAIMASMGYIFAGIPFIAVGIYFLIKKRTNIIVIIYTKAIVATLSFHNLPSGFLERSLTQNKITLSGEPGQDAEIMAKEIGTIIQDIQKSNKQNTD